MTHPIATIGYEGAGTDEMIAALRQAGVAALIDVCDAPVSRKPGFAKAELRETLTAAGFAYVHLGGLGNPEAGRRAAKAGRIEEYRRILGARLESAAGRTALDEAAGLARAAPVCLMCYERDPRRCHRLIVAERLAATLGAEIRHLHAARGLDSLPLFEGGG